MMITKIEIDINVENEKVFKSIKDFWKKKLIDLEDIVLMKDSECGKYEYVYIFSDESTSNLLVNIFLKNEITIFKRIDFTQDMINIINSNELENFKNSLSCTENFDEIMHPFIFEHITKDMVLDKINALGINSLTEQDYSILKS
jgi:hypothetical protein